MQLKPTHTPTNPDFSVSPALVSLMHLGIRFFFPEVWAKREANSTITLTSIKEIKAKHSICCDY